MKENVRKQADIMKKTNDIAINGGVVVFGSTYMARFPFYELAKKSMLENAVYNRSIEGLTVSEALEIAEDCVIGINPNKVFIALGEEDECDVHATREYERLIEKIRQSLPECKIYLIGLFGQSEYAQCFNRKIRELCDGNMIKYINLVSKQVPEAVLCKARFKQLSWFFRDKAPTMSDAFSLSCI